MKKIARTFLFVVMTLLVVSAFASCKSDKNKNSVVEEQIPTVSSNPEETVTSDYFENETVEILGLSSSNTY